MNEEELKKLLMIGFEYSFLHEDWVEPLEDSLAGVTARQARWRPGPEDMGIWDIVLHLAVWNENIVERVATGQVGRPAEGAWPPVPVDGGEEEWEFARARLRKSFEDVRMMIETTPVSKIEASPYGTGDLLCRFIHAGYHIGQIVKMRECVADLRG